MIDQQSRSGFPPKDIFRKIDRPNLSDKLFGQFVHSRYTVDMLRSNEEHCKRVLMLRFVRLLQRFCINFRLISQLPGLYLLISTAELNGLVLEEQM